MCTYVYIFKTFFTFCKRLCFHLVWIKKELYGYIQHFKTFFCNKDFRRYAMFKHLEIFYIFVTCNVLTHLSIIKCWWTNYGKNISYLEWMRMHRWCLWVLLSRYNRIQGCKLPIKFQKLWHTWNFYEQQVDSSESFAAATDKMLYSISFSIQISVQSSKYKREMFLITSMGQKTRQQPLWYTILGLKSKN